MPCDSTCNTFEFVLSLFHLYVVTSDESNRTWGRSTACQQEEFEDVKGSFKKRGCTWGPNSVQTKERADCKERYDCNVTWRNGILYTVYSDILVTDYHSYSGRTKEIQQLKVRNEPEFFELNSCIKMCWGGALAEHLSKSHEN